MMMSCHAANQLPQTLPHHSVSVDLAVPVFIFSRTMSRRNAVSSPARTSLMNQNR